MGILALICVAIVITGVLYVVVIDMSPPSKPLGIELEVYEWNDTTNRIVWRTKNIEGGQVIKWEDINAFIEYNNGTCVNVSLLAGEINIGDLIIVNAPWDGYAKLILQYEPHGGIVAETAIEHY